MGALASSTDIGPLVLAPVFQIVGLVVGAALRELVRFFAGSDPRRSTLWLAELVVVGVFAAILGWLFAVAADVTVVGPPFGAALTAYAALSAAHAYLTSRRLALTNSWLWAGLHAIACVLVGVLGFAAAVFVTGTGSH